jgi:hypothetical protein
MGVGDKDTLSRCQFAILLRAMSFDCSNINNSTTTSSSLPSSVANVLNRIVRLLETISEDNIGETSTGSGDGSSSTTNRRQSNEVSILKTLLVHCYILGTS